MTRYRVREGRVEACNGYRCWTERRFIAERRVVSLGFVALWWPVTGDWNKTECEAKRDIEYHVSLMRPLSKNKHYVVNDICEVTDAHD